MNKFAPLIESVSKITTVVGSTVAVLNGINDRIKKAVEEALAGGATAQELADAVTIITTELDAQRDLLAQAVAAATPAA